MKEHYIPNPEFHFYIAIEKSFPRINCPDYGINSFFPCVIWKTAWETNRISTSKRTYAWAFLGDNGFYKHPYLIVNY